MNSARRLSSSTFGFSLIEVTLAIGIVAFAVLPVMGLLPIGLNVNRQAIESTVSAQIISRVTHELSQTDFSSLPSPSNKLTFCFDDQGNLLASGSNGTLPSLTSAQSALRIYDAMATVNKPSSLPAGTIGTTSTTSLARVKIDVVSDPGGSIVIQSGTFSSTKVSAFFTFVSKND